MIVAKSIGQWIRNDVTSMQNKWAKANKRGESERAGDDSTQRNRFMSAHCGCYCKWQPETDINWEKLDRWNKIGKEEATEAASTTTPGAFILKQPTIASVFVFG